MPAPDSPALALDPHRGSAAGRDATVSTRRSLGRAARSVLVSLLDGLLEAFHSVVSPWLSAGCGWGCRFDPTCSRYARQALSRYGLWRGGRMAVYRLLRCNPLGGHGYDPVDREPINHLNRPQE